MNNIYTILKLERRNNSVNGNPKYEIYYTNESGILNHATTSSDSAFCYGITNDIYRESEPLVLAELQFTKSAKISGFKVVKQLFER
jgi:hypothetical protein